MHAAAGRSSDVDRLLLGCQQSVHGSRHVIFMWICGQKHMSSGGLALRSCVGAAARLGLFKVHPSSPPIS